MDWSDPEQRRQWHREYDKRNPRVRNKEQRRNYMKKYYQRVKDSDHVKEYRRQYYEKNKEHLREIIRRRHHEVYKFDKDRMRARKFSNRYGISLETYHVILSKQDGKCAICSAPAAEMKNGMLSVDHDHITGQVRGLLCGLCNTGVGYFRDSPNLLEAAARYLAEQVRA